AFRPRPHQEANDITRLQCPLAVGRPNRWRSGNDDQPLLIAPSHGGSIGETPVGASDRPQRRGDGGASSRVRIAGIRELRTGLWHWQAPHPEWTPDQWWPQLVSSYALDDGARLLLFDPLGVPEELLALAGERETAIVLTAPWHERDARSLVQRLGAPV